MASEESGLGPAGHVASAAETAQIVESQQIESASAGDVQGEKHLSPVEKSLNEKKDTDTDTSITEATSDDGGGRLPASRQSSSRSVSRSEKVATPVKDDPAVAAKKEEIRDACVQGDFVRLRQLAGSEGGFLTDELRQIAWPVLLGIPLDVDGHVNMEAAAEAAGISKDEDSHAWESLPPHRDEEQVQLDVNRAFVYYPTRMYSPPSPSSEHNILTISSRFQ